MGKLIYYTIDIFDKILFRGVYILYVAFLSRTTEQLMPVPRQDGYVVVCSYFRY